MIATDLSEYSGRGHVHSYQSPTARPGFLRQGYRCCSITPPPFDATESERESGWLRKRFRATRPLTPGLRLRRGVGAVKAPMI